MPSNGQFCDSLLGGIDVISSEFEPSPELHKLALTLSEWADGIPCIKKLILFGSRVRGDHRPNSDVDVRVEFEYSDPSVSTSEWETENTSDFASLKALLPGEFHLHQENDDAALANIRTGKLIYQWRKVNCIWTPGCVQTSSTSRP
jgi:predicted nucleotidyltransferase